MKNVGTRRIWTSVTGMRDTGPIFISKALYSGELMQRSVLVVSSR